jgi:hypothetical protein
VCWSIVVKGKSNVGSPFSLAFPSDRIPKATDDVNVHFFSNNFCKLYQRIHINYTCEFLELFEVVCTHAITTLYICYCKELLVILYNC